MGCTTEKLYSKESPYESMKNKTTFILILLLELSQAYPALAAKPGKSRDILSQLTSLLSNFKAEVWQTAKEFGIGFDQASDAVEQAIKQSIGVLGIPDPNQAGRSIDGVISELPSSSASISPRVLGSEARRSWDRHYSKAQTEAVLGKQGQEIMKQENDDMDNALSVAEDEAAQAESDTISQDLLRRMVRLQQQQIIGAKASQQEAQTSTKLAATTNTLLHNQAEREEGLTQRQHLEDVIGVSQSLSSAGFNNGLWADPAKK